MDLRAIPPFLCLFVSLVLLLACPCRIVVAQPEPFPPDPLIQVLVDQVSVDSLEATVNSLVGFHTRHTYSDTISNTVGIGAARRWVFSEFVRHGVDAEYFPWMGTWNQQPHQCYNCLLYTSDAADE